MGENIHTLYHNASCIYLLGLPVQHIGWLKQVIFIVSQFWRTEVEMKVSAGLVLRVVREKLFHAAYLVSGDLLPIFGVLCLGEASS